MDSEERSGSYFGMSLRIDSFCESPMKLIHLLDMVYEKDIEGKILSVNDNGKIKYLVSDFSVANSFFKSLEAKIFSLITELFSNKDFLEISIIPNNAEKIVKINSIDAIPKVIIPIISQSGKVYISDSYPTLKEIQIIGETKNSNALKEKDFLELNQSLNSCKLTIEKQAKDIINYSNNEKEKKDIIVNLEKTLSVKDGTINELTDKLNNQSSCLAEIKNAIINLKDNLEIINNFIEKTSQQQSSDKKKMRGKRKGIKSLFFSLGAICIVLLIGSCIYSSVKLKKDNKDLSSQMQLFCQTIDGLSLAYAPSLSIYCEKTPEQRQYYLTIRDVLTQKEPSMKGHWILPDLVKIKGEDIDSCRIVVEANPGLQLICYKADTTFVFTTIKFE